MCNSDELVLIQPADWTELRDLFEPNWPENIVGYSTIDNYIRWQKKDSKIKNLDIYSLNGTWRVDGTYVVVDRYQLFIYTLEKTNDTLERALNLLDWSKGFKVSAFLKRHRQAVLNVVKNKNLTSEYDSQTYLYYLPKKEAANLEINLPEAFSLRDLGPKDAEKADEVWPNKHAGSKFFLKRLAAWSPNVGLYDEKSELVAWCFQLQAGPLGALQVDDKHFKKGYGSIVAKAMVKKLASMDRDTFALVGTQNIPSQKMFEKVGFKHIDDAYWLRTFPTFDFTWED